MRQPQIEDNQVEALEVRTDAGEQFRGALHAVSSVAGPEQRRRKPIAYERGVVSDDDGLGRGHDGRSQHRKISALAMCALRARCRIYQVLVIIRSLLRLRGTRVRSMRRVRSRQEHVWPPARNVTPRSRSTSSTSTRAT